MHTNNDASAAEAFASLTPDNILDAVEARGIQCNGRFLALNSYENRVYQIGVENAPPIGCQVLSSKPMDQCSDH